MNRWIWITAIGMLLINSRVGYAQNLRFSSWSNNYLQLTSYSGNTAADAFTLRFEANGNIDVPLWKISVRLKQAIVSDSYVFPETKIGFQPSVTTGQMEPGPVPTVTQIGIPGDSRLSQGQEVFIVPQSAVSLHHSPSAPNGYYDLQIRYNLVVEGGRYLSQFRSWTNFYIPLEFKAYDEHNNVIGITEHTYQLQIGQLSGNFPSEEQFAIKVSANAVNGTLNLSSLSDYVNGTRVEYENGLSVKANTGYQVVVKSLQPSFSSASGNTLPLQTVSLLLQPVTGHAVSVFRIYLNAVSQMVVRGEDTQGNYEYFNIIYATEPNDETLVKATPDLYITTLQYEIIPL